MLNCDVRHWDGVVVAGLKAWQGCQGEGVLWGKVVGMRSPGRQNCCKRADPCAVAAKGAATSLRTDSASHAAAHVQIVKMAAQAAQEHGGNGYDAYAVRAKMAMLHNQWATAETLMLNQGRIDDTIAMYRDAYKCVGFGGGF